MLPLRATLSTADLQTILDRVTYKPGWLFRIYDGRWEGQHLVITTVVPDAMHPGQTTTLDVHSSLPPMRDESQFLEWIAWRLGRIENHEMREFLQLDGESLFNPHAEYADRDL